MPKKITNKEKAMLVEEELTRLYPVLETQLNHGTDYEFLFAVRLSAQCRDERVNIVTKVLFKKYKTLKEFADADLKELEDIVRPCGLGKTKASNIKEMANILIKDYKGELPNNMEELLNLPGVGRKTANLIMGDVFNKPAVVADTHNIRIAGRLGLTKSKNPNIVERDLWKVLNPKTSNDFSLRMVLYGREVCDARNPKCDKCTISYLCNYYKNNKN